MKLLLTGITHPGSIELIDGLLSIGRNPTNDFRVHDATVSSFHCELLITGNTVLVRDLNSTNGTFIDGAQIREAYLSVGVTLELGDVKLRFQNEVAPLEVAPSEEHRLGDLVGRSLPMRQVFALLARIAQSDATVLLHGETVPASGWLTARGLPAGSGGLTSVAPPLTPVMRDTLSAAWEPPNWPSVTASSATL